MRIPALLLSLALTLVLVRGDTSGAVVPSTQNPSPPPPLLSVDIVTFAAGSIIIPLDGCYARPSFMGNTDLEQILHTTYESQAATIKNKVCNTNPQKDDGVVPAYSLLQRLVLDGIPVHWALKGAKTSFNDWDFKISKAGGGPVVHMDRHGATDTRYAGLVEIRYAGAPFIIDAASAPAALAKMANYNQSDNSVTYDQVDFHVAQVSFAAPIYASLTTLPKLAVINLNDGPTALVGQPTGTNNTIDSVNQAIMADMVGTWINYLTIPDVNANRLITDGYQLVWVPPFDLPETPTAQQLAFIAKLSAFADSGGYVLFQDTAIRAMEGHGTFSQPGGYTQVRAPTGAYMTDGGSLADGIAGAWDFGDDNEATLGSDYSDPVSQFGGMVWTGIGGSMVNWQPRTDRAYLPGVRRMIFSDNLSNANEDNWDFAAWRHKDNDPAKGIIYYLGGENWRRVTAAGFRVLLNTIFVTAANLPAFKEISRASPIVAAIGTKQAVLQGTFEFVPGATPRLATSPADVPAFRFPYQKGHVRAIDHVDLSTAKTFGDPSHAILFDAASGIPTVTAAGCATPFNGQCRTVWTTLASGRAPPRVLFNTANAATLGPVLTMPLPSAPSTLTASNYPTLIARILAGIETTPGVFVPKLGGVDRSTVAVIPASIVAGGLRPTMVYFGATDGMLHAVCASVQLPNQGPCDILGRELWAYVPRTTLPELRLNMGRIDGSARAIDLFGDFDGDGRREFKTVLVFQTGDGDTTVSATQPATYAMDVTDPTNPTVLWEYTRDRNPTPNGFELGRGLEVAIGRVKFGTTSKLLAIAQTNNGGTGGPASVTTAIDVETGALVWEHEYLYPAPRDAANPSIAPSGMPGGAVGVDKTSTGVITDVVIGTLYGNVFLLDPTTGKSRFDAGNPGLPLFEFGSDFHPIGARPALFDDGGTQYALIGTGGFNDQEGASWNAGAEQFAVALSLNTVAAELPLAAPEPTPSHVATALPRVKFVFGFGAGENVFSQGLVVGNQFFFATDTTNVNGTAFGTGGTTGRGYQLSAAGAQVSTLVLAGGASSVVNNGTKLFAGSGDKQQRTTFDAASTSGASVDGAATTIAKMTRQLWLVQ